MNLILNMYSRFRAITGSRFMPFADAVSQELPFFKLFRLSMFQVSVGMAVVLLNGTLNRVMIVELGVSASLVAIMVSLPLLFAPFRVLLGFRSDNHESALGWRRTPYIWFGSLLQFGGLAIMPMALIVLSGDTTAPPWVGQSAAALAFLLTGIGLHTTQTAGLALATDLATDESKPQVVALLYVMLLVGMMISALGFGTLLKDFTQIKLIQVIQGAAVATMLLNVIALWKQEARNPKLTAPKETKPDFFQTWRQFSQGIRASRFLIMIGLGTAAFSMQDILLEPYGGQILHLSVGETTALTALLAGGTLIAFCLAAWTLKKGMDPFRLAAFGALTGVFAFSAVIFAEPLHSATVFRIGTTLIGFGGGLFAVGTLIAAMNMDKSGKYSGLALGAWGAVQATAAGAGIAFGGAIRDIVSKLAESGYLGIALSNEATGYSVVYHLEIALLFATLIAIGPLVGNTSQQHFNSSKKFGLAEFPG